MPIGRRPLRYIGQPNTGIELSTLAVDSGLSFLVIPSLGTTDLARGLPLSGGGGTRSTEPATFGVSRKLVVGSDTYADGGNIDPRYGYAWLLHGRLTALATWGGFFSRTKDDGTTQGLAWQRSNATDTINVYHDTSSGVATGTVSALLGDEVSTVIGLWRPSDKLELWKNGRLLAASTLSFTPGYTAGVGKIKVGSSRDTGYLTAEIGMAAFFTRPMPQFVAAELSRDPWLLVRETTLRNFIIPPPPVTQPELTSLLTTNITTSGARHSLTVTLP